MMNNRQFVVVAASIAFMIGCTVFTVMPNELLAKETDRTSKQSPLITRSYRTADLPIWSEGGKKFDHSIMIALLKAKIGDDAWNDDSSMAPYPQHVSLVVTTTKSNHDVIAKTIDDLRIEMFKRSSEFKRTTN